jgi:hypothetical protein
MRRVVDAAGNPLQFGEGQAKQFVRRSAIWPVIGRSAPIRLKASVLSPTRYLFGICVPVSASLCSACWSDKLRPRSRRATGISKRSKCIVAARSTRHPARRFCLARKRSRDAASRWRQTPSRARDGLTSPRKEGAIGFATPRGRGEQQARRYRKVGRSIHACSEPRRIGRDDKIAPNC